MTRLIALLIFILAMPAPLQARTLTPAEFTDAYVDAVVATQPSFSVVRKDPLRLSIKAPNGRTVTALLDNAYHDYMADPGQLEAILRKYIAFMVETAGRTDAIDPARIVPVVKDRQWLIEMQKAAAQQHSSTAAAESEICTRASMTSSSCSMPRTTRRAFTTSGRTRSRAFTSRARSCGPWRS